MSNIETMELRTGDWQHRQQMKDRNLYGSVYNAGSSMKNPEKPIITPILVVVYVRACWLRAPNYWKQFYPGKPRVNTLGGN